MSSPRGWPPLGGAPPPLSVHASPCPPSSPRVLLASATAAPELPPPPAGVRVPERQAVNLLVAGNGGEVDPQGLGGGLGGWRSWGLGGRLFPAAFSLGLQAAPPRPALLSALSLPPWSPAQRRRHAPESGAWSGHGGWKPTGAASLSVRLAELGARVAGRRPVPAGSVKFHATARTDGIRAVGFDIDRTLPLPAAGHLPWASQSEAPAPPASPPRRRRRLWFPPLPRALAALGSSTRLYAHVRYRAVVIPATWGLPPAVAAGLAAASPSSPAPVASAAAVVDATAAANGGGGKNLRPTPAPPPPASVLPVLEEDGHVVGVVSGEPEADRSWTTVSSFGVQHVVRWGRSARGGVSFRAGITADGEFVYGVRLF
ncbi:hypothetical protein I4F81_011503 [Pyropia yezoensis]|uniref:Uncharacterized protein n=1 Tax=Pyropia yezoensis TaxID=2788 RepID=A0ACC3CGA1_PYRYE|nr:hypothetical protein I4F81_011503 [Neopyropia yezoensis]